MNAPEKIKELHVDSINSNNPIDAVAVACQTIDLEIESINLMKNRLNGEFNRAVEFISTMKGRVVVVGMGKSGIIGQKIAATMASTGTPAFFVHPGEAFHGDLGMIKEIDVVLLISNSGETEEVLRILPFLEHQGNSVIALTGNTQSTLAKHSHVVLNVGVEREACKNNLAPTSSTTTTLVMGDALAVALTVQKNFQPEDFARFHPGGSLGKKLLTRVRDVMSTAPLPICTSETSFRDVITSISSGRLGLTLVMDGEHLVGIITDGDVRRAFESIGNVTSLVAKQIMSSAPLTIHPDVRFAEAEEFMHDKKVRALVVQEADGKTVGVLNIFDSIN